MNELPNPYDTSPGITDADRAKALASLARHLGIEQVAIADAVVAADIDRSNLAYAVRIALSDGRRFLADFEMRRRYEDHEWVWRED